LVYTVMIPYRNIEPRKGRIMTNFDKAKAAYFNEDSLELSMLQESEIQALSTWLEDNDHDGDYIWFLYEVGKEEMRCLRAEL